MRPESGLDGTVHLNIVTVLLLWSVLQKHQKNVRERQRALERLQQQVEERRTENKSLDHQLMELQVSVLERQAVDNLAGQGRERSTVLAPSPYTFILLTFAGVLKIKTNSLSNSSKQCHYKTVSVCTA